MPILLKRGQKIAGVDCPSGLLVIGLEKEVEAKIIEGGTAVATQATALAYTDPATGKLYSNGVEMTALNGLLSGAGRFAPLGNRDALCGDSFAFNATGGNVGGLTLTRSNGIVTVTGATGHPTYPGGYVNVVGTALLSDSAVKAQVQQYISSSSFTYAHPGPDGVIAAGAQSISIQWPYLLQSAGFYAHYNRFMSGGKRLVANCGISGAQVSTIAAAVSTLLTPYAPDRVFGFAGYNDINAGISVATTVASWVAAVAACPGAFWEIYSPWAFNAGAAADNAANLRKLQRYYPALKEAFKAYPNVRVHNSLAIIGASSGYAATGMVKASDNIHPSYRGFYTLAKYQAALDILTVTPVALPCTALDTRANDAASMNLVDNPLMTGAGGSAITNVTGTIPTGYSGALSSTGNATTGVSTTPARADGFGNDWQIVYTPATADTALRMSYSFNVARFVSGGTIDKIVMRVSVSGFAGNNAANIKSVDMVLVWIADHGDGGGNRTYVGSVQDASASGEGVTYTQQEDMVEVTLCLRDVPVPLFTSLSTARLDFTISHFASSATAVTAKVARAQLELAA
jgi:hypothetical protein